MKDVLRKHIESSNRQIKLKLGTLSNLRPLGEGGNGIVYSGEILNNQVAVKFLVNESQSKSKLDRFKSEYLNVALLSSRDFIVKLIAYDEIVADGHQFPAIVMRKYENSLKDVVRMRRANQVELTKADLEKLLDFLINSLEFIHSNGIVHRDLKPENILVCQDSLALTDFGIAYYHPEHFRFKAKTEKNERLANRLFAAPEQSESNVTPDATMDIYALGQICQWYATGKTHRGTGRERLMRYLPGSDLIDGVVERCLSNAPDQRFQSIAEIREHLSSKNTWSDKQALHKKAWQYIDKFHDVLSKTFPKLAHGFFYTEEARKINFLLENLASQSFDGNLWWITSRKNSLTEFKKLDNEIWLMGMRTGVCYEIKVRSIQIYNDNSYYNDWILINLDSMPSFDIYEYESQCGREEGGLVDDKYYVTREEYDNGYAEVEGETVDLSEHTVELRMRDMVPRSYFIATAYHCVQRWENDKTVRDFIQLVESGHMPDKAELEKFSELIRRHKHEVSLML